jgi:MprA protease rhombosortase-interaction domain-containing protein
MFGNKPPVNSLESRKQLLVAESDFNRAQLAEEWVELANHVHSLTDRAKKLGSIASAAALLVTGLAAFHRRKSASAGAKRSWLQTILKSAGWVSTMWLAFRSQGGNQKDN